MGASYGYVISRLQFDSSLNADLRQHAVVASLGYRFTPNTTMQLSVGAVLAGDLTASGIEHRLQKGFLASAQVSHQWLEPGKPFLVTSLSFGFSNTDTIAPTGEVAPLVASDARISLLYGYRVLDGLSPFLLARAFSGPVAWQEFGVDRTGADRDHYALGAGAVLRLGAWGLSLSGSALGERSVSAGLSYDF